MNENFLASTKKLALYYKQLADKAIAQVSWEQMQAAPNGQSNSIVVTGKHIAGNMLSRWTNFLTEDGEKEWRHRDQEFEDGFEQEEDFMAHWENGWKCFLDTIHSLTPNDMERTIYIRNEGHSVIEAIMRQLSHYPYHVGQIVYVARFYAEDSWTSLSIPKGNSSEYNKKKFSDDKSDRHFTDKL